MTAPIAPPARNAPNPLLPLIASFGIAFDEPHYRASHLQAPLKHPYPTKQLPNRHRCEYGGFASKLFNQIVCAITSDQKLR